MECLWAHIVREVREEGPTFDLLGVTDHLHVDATPCFLHGYIIVCGMEFSYADNGKSHAFALQWEEEDRSLLDIPSLTARFPDCEPDGYIPYQFSQPLPPLPVKRPGLHRLVLSYNEEPIQFLRVEIEEGA